MESIPSRLVMSSAFAGGENASVTLPSTDATISNMSFENGFGENYSVPGSQGGKYVTRAEMNGLGKIATNDMFRYKCGGLNTFDADFAAAVGGYPKGAVLQILSQGALWYVESLQQHNKVDFTGLTPTSEQYEKGIRRGSVDGINWRYCYESKYVQDDEYLFTSIKKNTVTEFTQASTQHIYAKKAEKSGFITIRNLFYEFDALVTEDKMKAFPQTSLRGTAIIVESLSAEESSSFESIKATDTDAGKWISFPVMMYGQINSIGATEWIDAYNSTSTLSIPNGLPHVVAGEYVYIDLLNGFQGFLANGASAAGTIGIKYQYYPIKSISFDVYII